MQVRQCVWCESACCRSASVYSVRMRAAGPPVWLHTDNEEIYEPLATASSLPLPEDMALCEDSSTRDIGDWGELLVRNYLETVVVSSSSCLIIVLSCPVWGRLFPPCPFTSSSFPFSLFPFFHWLYLFSSFVHPFPFYQNSPTPFPGRR